MAVVSRTEHTYQATDLAGSGRRAFLTEAKEGLARLRDQDGSSLVMLPEANLNVLSGLRTQVLSYLALENALTRPRSQRRPTDFGELAWAEVLDDDDLDEFRDEFRDVLARAASASDLGGLNEVIRAWRLTAELLGDRTAATRLRETWELTEYSELARPEDRD